ncbi:hypothetical protein DFH09DRAFT_1340013 [Mycena vulgaris]|nr:hypothetical protein DFH09DRAFT_1340013 [Mycena vulgaris]
MAGSKGKKKNTSAPRPSSRILVDIDRLADILSQCQVPSVAMEDQEAPEPSPRFILTRSAKKDLAVPAAAPQIPLDASLVTPAKSPSAPPSPARSSAPHRPAAQLRVFAHQSPPAAANTFGGLATAPDTVFATTSSTPDVTEDPSADQAGSGALGKRGGARNERDARGVSPPLADRHVSQAAPVPSEPSRVAPQTSAARNLARKPSKSKEKEAAFLDLKERSDAAQSFDDIASIFKATIRLMKDYKSTAPTSACFSALEALESRLENHLLK